MENEHTKKPTLENPTKVVTVRMTRELHERLMVHCKAIGVSANQFCCEAIRLMLPHDPLLVEPPKDPQLALSPVEPEPALMVPLPVEPAQVEAESVQIQPYESTVSSEFGRPPLLE